ncbi:MAG: TetR family transcriptional regulator [Rhodobiaceae bacterium]|nr:MAG: TetR family transcriptional regulator [Rhodobiaceae bacterium]
MAVAQGTLRKTPTQARSKARFERILSAASDLIARNGSEHLKMSDVATGAEVPIGSVYQYFPDKSAIVLTLADRFMSRVREALAEAMSDIETAVEANDAVTTTLRNYYALFLAEPVARDIWFGVQADKTLLELDIEDSRANADIVFRALRRFTLRKNWQRLHAACFLIMQLSGMAVRLAISLERKEGDRIMAIYEGMIRRELIENLTSD